MNKFINYILQLIISTSTATLEVLSLRPRAQFFSLSGEHKKFGTDPITANDFVT